MASPVKGTGLRQCVPVAPLFPNVSRPGLKGHLGEMTQCEHRPSQFLPRPLGRQRRNSSFKTTRSKGRGLKRQQLQRQRLQSQEVQRQRLQSKKPKQTTASRTEASEPGGSKTEAPEPEAQTDNSRHRADTEPTQSRHRADTPLRTYLESCKKGIVIPLFPPSPPLSLTCKTLCRRRLSDSAVRAPMGIHAKTSSGQGNNKIEEATLVERNPGLRCKRPVWPILRCIWRLAWRHS